MLDGSDGDDRLEGGSEGNVHANVAGYIILKGGRFRYGR
ncbi:hypothetical protein G7077_03035 [Sphingomonas piscis]|uniref:Uncharacterized protein n=1 Tax=Sphingomonas piscis TaxID=2714943 RepID=A0A6G7YMS8_9SPHN|nr:hypothetical protein G7077_03035 [Sphingomonas piscis]